MMNHDTDRFETAWTNYQRMRVRLADRLNRVVAQRTGLSEADFEILVALSEQPDTPIRALALRCGLEWEKSRLSHQLRRMEQRGLVTRAVCEEDNRSTLIRLTPHGHDLALAARHCYDHAVHHHVADALTAEQIDALREIADTILERLDRDA